MIMSDIMHLFEADRRNNGRIKGDNYNINNSIPGEHRFSTLCLYNKCMVSHTLSHCGSSNLRLTWFGKCYQYHNENNYAY